jgi:hypothetical protein
MKKKKKRKKPPKNEIMKITCYSDDVFDELIFNVIFRIQKDKLITHINKELSF